VNALVPGDQCHPCLFGHVDDGVQLAGIDSPKRVGVGFQGGRAVLAAGYSRTVMPNVKVAFGGSVSGNEANGGVGAGFGW
jgi:hypothetical protein